MLTKAQLAFIKESICSKGFSVPTENEGKAVRMFLSVLDEIDKQLKSFDQPEPEASS